MKKRITEVAEMLEKELPFHTIEDKKAEVERYQIYAAIELPTEWTFIPEYEIYRRNHEKMKPEVLIVFGGHRICKNDFLDMMPESIPETIIDKSGKHLDSEKMGQVLFQNLYDGHLLKVVEDYQSGKTGGIYRHRWIKVPLKPLDITFRYKLMNESRLLKKSRFFYDIGSK